MHDDAIPGRSALCFDFVQRRLSRICFENRYAAHTPILPNLNFIPWWRSEAQIWRMCIKQTPDNEIQILRLFDDAWMRIWYTICRSKSPALLWVDFSSNAMKLEYSTFIMVWASSRIGQHFVRYKYTVFVVRLLQNRFAVRCFDDDCLRTSSENTNHV